jgi:predicted RNA-binding Zn-ribbon protein involved in translation (DUF1610 family)
MHESQGTRIYVAGEASVVMLGGVEWLGVDCPNCGQAIYVRFDNVTKTPLPLTCAHCGRTFVFTARMRFALRVRRALQRRARKR